MLPPAPVLSPCATSFAKLAQTKSYRPKLAVHAALCLCISRSGSSSLAVLGRCSSVTTATFGMIDSTAQVVATDTSYDAQRFRAPRRTTLLSGVLADAAADRL